MNNYYRKINLTDYTHKKVFDIIDKVESVVLEKDPYANDFEYWGLCENKLVEVKTRIDFDTWKYSDFPMNITIEEIFEIVPDFKDFIDQFDLVPYLGKVMFSDWGIHRHMYSPNCKWNMCVLGNNIKDCTIGFHIPKRNEYNQDCEYYYEYLLDEDFTTEVELNVNTGEIYSFHVSEWHSLFIPKHVRPNVYLFYFDHAITEQDIDYNVERIIRL